MSLISSNFSDERMGGGWFFDVLSVEVVALPGEVARWSKKLKLISLEYNFGFENDLFSFNVAIY